MMTHGGAEDMDVDIRPAKKFLNLSHNFQINLVVCRTPTAGANIATITANMHCRVVSSLIIVLKHHRIQTRSHM